MMLSVSHQRINDQHDRWTAVVPPAHAHAAPLQVTQFVSDQVLNNWDFVCREEVVIPFMSEEWYTFMINLWFVERKYIKARDALPFCSRKRGQFPSSKFGICANSTFSKGWNFETSVAWDRVLRLRDVWNVILLSCSDWLVSCPNGEFLLRWSV